jgi:hypothetical protein
MLLAAAAGCSSVPAAYHPIQPLDPAHFSHDLFDQVLRAHVMDGLVAYSDLRRNEHLQEYLAELDRLDPAGLPTDRDRIALWINAYNAFAIQGILDGYSPMTLWGRYRYFIAREYRVGGKTVDLYDLERSILIPFREPRIHFAIVCASRSCPKLQPWAYRGALLHEQLESVTRAFINDPSRNRFDRTQKRAYLSKIFDWWHDDFAGHSDSVQRFVAQYVNDRELADDLITAPYAVEYLEYDWSLNGAPPGKTEDADPSS